MGEEPDTRTVEEMLRTLAVDARRWFEAEREFNKWWRIQSLPPGSTFFERLAAVHEAGMPYDRTYRRMTSKFPDQMHRFEEIVFPIQHEYYPRK